MRYLRLLTAALLVVAGCSRNWDLYEFRDDAGMGGEAGSGGSAGKDGNGGTGGESGGGSGSAADSGTAGDGGVPNSCEDVVCNTPPAAKCEEDQRVWYDTVGTCDAGRCVYEEQDETCTYSCRDGECQPCDPGFADCDGDTGNGCEQEINTLQHCGACDKTCGPLDHATPTCAYGSCEVAICSSGFGDCDEEPTNGCESSLKTLQNCRQCGRTCTLDHATESCSSGTCLVTECDTGWANCNGDHADGCEHDLGGGPC